MTAVLDLVPNLVHPPKPAPAVTPRALRELAQCIHRTCGKTRTDYIARLVCLDVPAAAHDMVMNPDIPTVRPNREQDLVIFRNWCSDFEAAIAEVL